MQQKTASTAELLLLQGLLQVLLQVLLQLAHEHSCMRHCGHLSKLMLNSNLEPAQR